MRKKNEKNLKFKKYDQTKLFKNSLFELLGEPTPLANTQDFGGALRQTINGDWSSACRVRDCESRENDLTRLFINGLEKVPDTIAGPGSAGLLVKQLDGYSIGCTYSGTTYGQANLWPQWPLVPQWSVATNQWPDKSGTSSVRLLKKALILTPKVLDREIARSNPSSTKIFLIHCYRFVEK